MRALTLDLNIFVNPKNKRAANLIKKYITKYKAPPSLNTLKRFADHLAGTDIEKAKQYVSALRVLNNLPKVKTSDAEFEFTQAHNYRTGRDLVQMTEGLQSKFESGDDNYVSMRKAVISDLLASSPDEYDISRGKIYERIKNRFQEYEDAERGSLGDIIPFGIRPLDEKTGGMRKTFVTLIYSKTGGGKTRTAVNVAYNAAIAGYNVMYISLEMSFNLIASCFDSRMAWVDGNQIIFGKLSKKDKRKYARALKKQIRDKLNVWLVDVSMHSSSSLILEEIELYKAINGISPDLVIVDYANLMEPTKRYTGRSEKYDYLFKEYHSIAKYANIALLTFTQESREATKADIEAKQKKKAFIEQGVHNIALSNFMAPHCETVIRLKQDNRDALQNRLWAIIDKYRYGAAGIEIPLLALWDKNYVGDRIINSKKVYKLIKSKAYQEEEP
jgi:replicative DNA helicase